MCKYTIITPRKFYPLPKEEITMIQLIVGAKGKGKTKILLDKVNTEVRDAHGSIVYLDKSPKHMYELNNMFPDSSWSPVESLSASFMEFFLRITIWSRCILTVF